MKRLSDKAWLLALAIFTGCGSDGAGSTPDSAPEPGDVGVSVMDAAMSSVPEASTDPGNQDAAVLDAGTLGEADADRDAAVVSVDAGDASALTDAAGGVDAADASHGAACQHASDCRLVSFECTGCDCLALGTADTNPVCSGTGVQCLRDPCQGLTAACQGGHCISQ